MTRLFLLLLTVTLFAACGENTSEAEMMATQAQETAQATAYESLMDAHDRVMPMMGRITGSQKAIVDELATEGVDEERRELLKAADEQLEDAGDAMMTWMGNIKSLDELRADLKNEAIITYIREESGNIAQVESQMVTAITNAEELLGGHNHDGHDHDHDHGDHQH